MRDYDPEDPEDADGGGPGEEPDDEDEAFYLSVDEEFDDLTMEGLFRRSPRCGRCSARSTTTSG